jgi:hypothetical protein
MEWLGTGFTLTIGGIRLRVRIALEDAPFPARPASACANSPVWTSQTNASPSSGKTGNGISTN